MDAEAWQRARALFERLADAPPSTWEAQLQALCPDDAALRAEALALLRADAQAGGEATAVAAQAPALLEAAAAADDAAATARLAGTRLGPFVLQRELGRGGMGQVWLAERADGAFQQRVAIKLLRNHWDRGEDLARFRAERQILAGLQHPNIAHLVDGGVSDAGLPWLALEYVDGSDLRQHCDAHRLDLPQRLRLFLTVCAAVNHAHQRLVVHRDLKPSNILVGADGAVKLLDFGIAKLLDAETAASATRLFTPEYAAPEQVRGEAVTTAVDVYALGLLLYELLTGRRPYRVEHSTPAAYEQAILGQEPTRPSLVVTRTDDSVAADELAARRHLDPRRLRRELRGDLDAIVLKALRKEPAQRYASVAELAADVQAWLERRPVAARRGSWRYRSGRFLRRHALAAGLAALALLGLSGGLVVALAQRAEARHQRDIARSEAETARHTVDVLVGVFSAANPARHPGETLTPADLLKEGEREVQTKLADRPRERAALLEALGRAYSGLGQYDQAQPLLDAALALRLAGDDRLAEASVRLALSAIASRRSQNEAALRGARDVLALSQGDSREARELRATALLHLGIEQGNLDRLAEAESSLREAAAMRAVLFGTDDERYWQVLVPLSYFLAGNGRSADALSLLDPVWEAIRARTQPGDTDRAYLLDARGYALSQAGRYADAVPLQEEAVANAKRVYGEDHPDFYKALNNLAVFRYRAGDARQAAEDFERVRAWGETHPDRRTLRRPDNLLRGLAQALDDSRQHERALRVLDDLEALRNTLALTDAHDRAEVHLLRARVLRHARRFDAAQAALDAYRIRLDANAAEVDRAAADLEGTRLQLDRGDRPTCEDADRAAALGGSAGTADRWHAKAVAALCWRRAGREDKAMPLLGELREVNVSSLLPVPREAVQAALAVP